MKKNDYLIIDTLGGVELAKVQAILSNRDLRVLLETGCHLPDTRQILDIERETIILNLGKSPRPGYVYGVSTNDLYVKTKQHDIVGDVHFFYKPTREVFSSLWKSFNIAERRLKKHGLGSLLTDDINWQIYSKESGGKYAGFYSNHGDTKTISIHPEKMTAPEFPYVIAHELGHHFHFTYLYDSPPLNGAWIKLYTKSIKVTPVSKKDCNRIQQLFYLSDMTVQEFKKSLEDPGDQRSFAKICSWIKTNHQLDTKAINLLLGSNNWDSIKEMWPTQVSQKELAPVVSQYATTKWTELFAEAFAFYITGIALPKEVTRLIERSISYGRNRL